MHDTSDGTFWGILGGLKVGDSWSMGLFLEVEVERKKTVVRKSMELCFGTKTGKWSIDGTFLGILGGLKTRADWAMGLLLGETKSEG